jgi:hypothetical protein
MAGKKDPRRTPGAAIHAKATSITSLAECARRYGNRKKLKWLTGKVLRVEICRNGGRNSTWIHGIYDLGGNTPKEVCLHSSSVKAGPAVQEEVVLPLLALIPRLAQPDPGLDWD